MEFTVTLREILIGVVIAAALYLVEVLVLSRTRRSKSTLASETREDSEGLRTEVEILNERISWLAARLAALEAGQADRAPQTAPPPVPPSVQTPAPSQARTAAPPQPPAHSAPPPSADLLDEYPPPSLYSLPVQYAREGLSAEVIASRCGISRGEAELLIALHVPDKLRK